MKKLFVPILLGSAMFALFPFTGRTDESSGNHASDWMGTDLEDAHDDFFLWYTKELGLTEAQVDKLKKVKLEAQEKRKKIWKTLHRARMELREILHQDEPNREQINEKAEKIGALQGDLIKLRAKTVLDEKKVLTKNQLKKFDELMMTPPPSERKGHPAAGK